MLENEFIVLFDKLCAAYMANPQKLKATSHEYYYTATGCITKLGQLTKEEFADIIDYCKDNRVKPDYGSIPQIYQLLGFYRDFFNNGKKQASRSDEYYCDLCDNTGFVSIKSKKTKVEAVCACSCLRGEQKYAKLRDPKGRDADWTPIPIASLKNINRNQYDLLAFEDDDVPF